MSKRFIFISFPLLLIAGVYFLGPEPDKPVFDKGLPEVPQDLRALEQYVARKESQHKIKPDNEARIFWAGSSKKKTPFSVIYLHGFSASQKEGDPVHWKFAKEFGCNLYLSRLADHGIDTTEQLLNFTPDRLWASTKEALAIGKAIGEKVIVMSTSTGGTMALMLAAEYPEDVFALVNMSPNISLHDPNAWLLNDPWGLQIARLVIGGRYQSFPKDSLVDQYWNNPYRIEAIVQLEELLEEKMTKETFNKIKCPSLTLYYYKNEQEQDLVVEVSTMLEMNRELGTPDSLKTAVPIPEAGHHVIGSMVRSKDLGSVERETEKFAIEKLHLKKVNWN